MWVGRSAVEYPACVEHEALINLALADRPVTILCSYDAARLEPAVLTDLLGQQRRERAASRAPFPA